MGEINNFLGLQVFFCLRRLNNWLPGYFLVQKSLTCLASSGPGLATLPFRWTQVKKKGPLQTPKPLIFFLFPISENVDVEILQRGNFEKKLFLRFVMGLFSPGPEVFSRYLWNGRSTLKIEENKMHFFSILGLDGSSPNSLGPPGTLWDPFWTLWDPLRGPRESQRRNSSQSSIGKLLGIMTRATFLLKSDLNSTSGTLWDP